MSDPSVFVKSSALDDAAAFGLDDSDESQLEQDFAAATKYLEGLATTLDQATLLKFYGLYKQVTIGPCNVAKPGMFSLQAKAKWNAWNNLKHMSAESAMQEYVRHMTTLKPDWQQKQPKNKANQWVSVSQPAIDPSEHLDDSSKSCSDHVKDGNEEKLIEHLSSIVDINALDENGLALVHWAADRGNSEVLNILLNAGANVNIVDPDGQTALHYATSVGHADCVQVLLTSGADKMLLDKDGQSPLDVATDQAIKDLLI